MAILFDSGYGLFDSAAGNFDDGGVLSPTASVSGITLTSALGTITENVSDQIQITGLKSTITAGNISATGIQNSNIVITGLELSSAFGNINEIVNDSVSISGLDALADIATISANGIQNANISVRRVGIYAGKAFSDIDKSEQSHYFLILDDISKLDMIITELNKKTWVDLTVGPRSISKGELNEVINLILA